METTRPVSLGFHKGDDVLLAEGTYQGTHGVFLQLREDRTWADIHERNGRIRSHPVAWLVHSKGATKQLETK